MAAMIERDRPREVWWAVVEHLQQVSALHAVAGRWEDAAPMLNAAYRVQTMLQNHWWNGRLRMHPDVIRVLDHAYDQLCGVIEEPLSTSQVLLEAELVIRDYQRRHTY